jgi:hypothetical protein
LGCAYGCLLFITKSGVLYAKGGYKSMEFAIFDLRFAIFGGRAAEARGWDPGDTRDARALNGLTGEAVFVLDKCYVISG